MQLPKRILLLTVLPTALAATVAECQLGSNRCNSPNTSVMICGAQGWKVTETCSKVGACHIGASGNAYCDKEVQCTPGGSQCDTANYVAKSCDDSGFWKTDRKCAKPGCCEIRSGKAVCKAECGPGQQPPARLSFVKVARGGPRVGDRCASAGEGYCDEAHNCVLRCNDDKTFHLEKCCKGKDGCIYDNASLEPYCR